MIQMANNDRKNPFTYASYLKLKIFRYINPNNYFCRTFNIFNF